MALISNPHAGPYELECQRICVGCLPGLADEEISDVDAERPGDGFEPTRGDTIGADLVFVELLISDSDPLRQWVLSQSERDPARPNPPAHLAIDLGQRDAPTGRPMMRGIVARRH